MRLRGEDEGDAELPLEGGATEIHGGARETTTFGRVADMDYEERSRDVYRIDGAGSGAQGVSRAGYGTGGGGGGGAVGGGGPMATSQREEQRRGRGRPQKEVPVDMKKEIIDLALAGYKFKAIAREVGGISTHMVRKVVKDYEEGLIDTAAEMGLMRTSPRRPRQRRSKK